MKKTILILIITTLILSNLYGQPGSIIWSGQSSSVYYVIPPTNGCNGVWAINSNLWPGCIAAYTITPCWDTAVGFQYVGDTLFITLCSVPCNIIAACAGGGLVFCDTGTPLYTSIDTHSKGAGDQYKLLSGTHYSGSNKLVKIRVEQSSEIILTNTQGQIVATKKGIGIIEFDIQGQSPGLYVISIISGQVKFDERIIIE